MVRINRTAAARPGPSGWLASGLVRTRCVVRRPRRARARPRARVAGPTSRRRPRPRARPRHRRPRPPRRRAAVPGSPARPPCWRRRARRHRRCSIDAIAGANGCLDQVTLTFNGDGIPPGYVVGYRDPEQEPFLDGDPPVDDRRARQRVPGGEGHARVELRPARARTRPAPTPATSRLEYGEHHHLQIVRELPDTADTVMWVIGLDSVRPFRVDRAEDPRRVTVLIG